MYRVARFSRKAYSIRTLSTQPAKRTKDPARMPSQNSSRLAALREQLAADEAKGGFASFTVADSEDKYDSALFSDQAKAFLTSVNELYNKKYSRGGQNGEGFVGASTGY